MHWNLVWVFFFAGENGGGESSRRIGDEAYILGDVNDVSLWCGAARCGVEKRKCGRVGGWVGFGGEW
jgi:hypothetical protein